MKKYNLIFLGLITAIATMAQGKSYTINGRLSKEKEGQIFFWYIKGDKFVRDSSTIKDGKFKFAGTIDGPTQVDMSFKPTGADYSRMSMELLWAIDSRSFFLQPGNITISGDKALKAATITGAGNPQEDYSRFEKRMQPLNDKLRSIEREYNKNRREKNEEGIKKADIAMHNCRAEIEEAENVFIKENPKSYVSLDLLKKRSGNMGASNIEPLFKQLSPKLQNTAMGKSVAEKIDQMRHLQVGVAAPEFIQNDTLGNPVSLSSFKGKYVLIDFWASWCAPCRAENPNVVNAYNAYKDKGFTVLGVSLDNPGKKQSWLDAIHKDGLPWTQVSDLKGWKNAVALQYNIHAVPTNLLLDKNGVIIAKDLSGDALQKKLEEVFAHPIPGFGTTINQ